MTKNKNQKIQPKTKNFLILICSFGFWVLSFGFVLAGDATFNLTPPGIEKGETPEFMALLGWILKLLLGSTGILAFLMIVVGGLQYVAAGASGNPEKVQDARNRILMAIGGLLLALGSWLILSIINPDLLKLELKLPGA